jgi:glycosyltransferase involved in cell wall biosynthesis
MGTCDAFVLSSSYETFGVVVVEALMNGKPVVATRCGGPEDIVVPGEDGLLVEKDNPEALAAAMLELRAQRDRFDAAAIRQRCIDRFGEAAFVRRHAKVYQAALSSSRPSAAP